MSYDSTIYQGIAPYYARGRVPYSRELIPAITAEVGLKAAGRMLDVGTGPGILAIALAPLFDEVVALDPDPEMLAEGKRKAADSGITNIRWVQAVAEEIPALGLGTFQLATFGQSFYWTNREQVAEAVYDLLVPGGAIAIIVHRHQNRPVPSGPGYPQVPHDELNAIVDRYLGTPRRAGQGLRNAPTDSSSDALARTRFGSPRATFAPGRQDVLQDVDTVVAGLLSMSYAAPHLFGDRLDDFVPDVRALLHSRSESGLFWNWPGDTEILIARKLGPSMEML